MFDEDYAEAGAALLDAGGFRAAMGKLALVENLLATHKEDQLLEVLSQQGALEGLQQVLSEAVHQYFSIASKTDTEIEGKLKAEEATRQEA